MPVDRLPAGVGDERRAGASSGARAPPAGRRSAGRVAACPAGKRSSSIASTVSCASFLLVPITPDGPRLIQPTTYSPRRRRSAAGSTTRPSIVRDHGAAARRTGRPAAAPRGSRPRGTPVRRRSSPAHPLLSRAARRPRPRPARCGQLDRRQAAVVAGVRAPAVRAGSAARSASASRWARARRSRAGSRRCARDVASACARSSSTARARSSSSASTITSASASSPSSSSSGLVNAAWAGPRRPTSDDLAHGAAREHRPGRGRRCRSARAPRG